MRPLLTVARSTVTGFVLGRRPPAPRLRPLDLSPFEAALAPWDDAAEARLAALVDRHTVAGLHELLSRGEVRSRDLVLLCLRRIRRDEERLHALVELDPRALEAADAADARLAAGDTSPWCGVPVVVKDNVETAPPLHTTAGAEVLLDHVAEADAEVVARLRAAGAVVLGKANLSELAGALLTALGYSAVGGPTRHPRDARWSPAGSSSGSAVAVAAGFCLAAVGTETAGSILVPASWVGVVGIRPAHGTVPDAGVVPLVPAFDTAGPLARCVEDAASLLRVMSAAPLGSATGEAPSVHDGPARPPRVGVLRADVLTMPKRLEPTQDNAEVLDRVVHHLTGQGWTAVDVELSGGRTVLASLEKQTFPVVLAGLAQSTVGYVARATAGSPHPVRTARDLLRYNLARPGRRMRRGQLFLDLAVARGAERTDLETDARRVSERSDALLREVLDRYGLDLLLSLSHRHVGIGAAAGWPAVSVPAGTHADRWPVGAVLMAPPEAQEHLLRWAEDLKEPGVRGPGRAR